MNCTLYSWWHSQTIISHSIIKVQNGCSFGGWLIQHVLEKRPLWKQRVMLYWMRCYSAVSLNSTYSILHNTVRLNWTYRKSHECFSQHVTKTMKALDVLTLPSLSRIRVPRFDGHSQVLKSHSGLLHLPESGNASVWCPSTCLVLCILQLTQSPGGR